MASDVYALGAVMAELGVARWAKAVRACKAKDPAARPASAAAVLAMTRPDRRWRVALVAAAAIAAVAVAVVAWPRPAAAPPPSAIRAPAAVAADFGRGAAMLRDIHPVAARTALRTVVDAAPGFAPAWAQLAAAELGAGDPAAARVSIARAAEVIAKDPARWTQAEKLLVDARRAELASDWAAASAAWLALDGLDPATTEHGVALAYTQMRAGQLDVAKQTIARIRRRAPDDAHLDLIEARVADREGELDKELQLGKRVVAAGEARGSRALVGQGQVAIGTAALYLGKNDEARAALDAAETAYTAEANPIGLVEVVRMRSAIQWMAGDLAGARKTATAALAIADAAGDRRGQANVHGTLAVLANSLREFEPALAHTRAARERYRELGDDGQVAWAAQQMGNIEHARGRLDTARVHWREGLQIAVSVGERTRVGDLAHNLGEIAADEGDLGAARLYFDQALASYESIREQRLTAVVELSLAWLLAARGDTAGARARVRRAEEIARELGLRHREVHAGIVGAHVALAEGALDEAAARVSAARTSGVELEPETAHGLALAELELALARGRPAEARTALAAARAAAVAARALRTGDVAGFAITPRLELSIALARVERAGGMDDAAATLAALADEAASYGLAQSARRARAP